MRTRCAVASLTIVCVTLYIEFHGDMTVPLAKPLLELPLRHGPWEVVSAQHMDARTLAVLKPSDYLSRRYRDDRCNEIDVYVGYHDGGEHSGPIHSPKHCLPGAGWFPISERIEQIQTPAGELSFVQAVYRKDAQDGLFLYWYQVGNTSLTNEYSLKLRQLANSALYGRRETSFIRVIVSCREGIGQADSIGKRFLRDFYPLLAQSLPR